MEKIVWGTIGAMGGSFIGGLVGDTLSDSDAGFWFFLIMGALGGIRLGTLHLTKGGEPSEQSADLSSHDVEGTTVPSAVPPRHHESSYAVVIPELIAACVSADGELSEAEVDLAMQFLENDDLIVDKATALASLHTHHERFSKARHTARPIYKLKLTTVIHKTIDIQNPLERARILVILEAMFETAGDKPQDEIRYLITEVKKGWEDAPKLISKAQAAEEFVLRSGDREAIDAFRKMKADPAHYERHFKQAAKGNSVMRIALGVFTGVIAAELVTGAIYQHQLQEALAQFDMELASLGGFEALEIETASLDAPSFQTASWHETDNPINSSMDADELVIDESAAEGFEDGDIESDFDFFV